MNENYNKVLISGTINVITDDNQEYIKFGLITTKYTLSGKTKVYVSLNIARALYNVYKDFFTKGTKVFIKGYLNYYISNNKIINFITVTNISNNQEEILNYKKAPHIRCDADGVMVWNGKRCEKAIPTEEELQEMEELLKDFK